MLEEWAQYHAEWDQWMADLEESWSKYQDDINAQWTAYQNTMNTAWQSLQNFINDYFDNLDVQEEVNNKIISMIQTGEFGQLVNEYIPPAVTAWLALNITQPTGVVIDTSLTVAGACADAKATGDAINKVLTIYEGTEIEGYDKSYVREDCTTEATKTDDAYCYNAYVDNIVKVIPYSLTGWSFYELSVNPGEVYHIKTETVGTPRAYYYATSEDVYISRVPSDQAATPIVIDDTITIPDNVGKLFVNERATYSEDFIFERITESSYFSFNNEMTTLINNVNQNVTDINNLKQNVFEGYTKTTETFVDCISDAVETEGSYCYNGYVDNVVKIIGFPFTGFNYYKLDVVAGETYHIRTTTQNTPRAYYFAKSDGTYISRFPDQQSETLLEVDEIVTIPANVEALYVNQFLNTSIPFAIERKMNFYTYNRNSEWYSFDALYNKKLACVGDSMTEATDPNGGYFKNYAQIVAERHKMSIYKDGIGGSTMANVSGHDAFSDTRYLNVPNDYDILTIWFGWNDATYATVGNIDDTTDTTFYGAYNKVLNYFISQYPTKKIGLIVPYGNASVEPFRVAVRNLSEKFGVPCLDLTDYHNCSCIWGTANAAQEARRSALTYDGTHPNQTGHYYLSTMYEEFIKKL